MITSSGAYVVAAITLKVVVVTSLFAKITFVVDETAFKVAVITFSVAKIIFVVTAITLKVAVSSSVAKIIFESAFTTDSDLVGRDHQKLCRTTRTFYSVVLWTTKIYSPIHYSPSD